MRSGQEAAAIFPRTDTSWLDTLADVDMMQTKSEGQDGVCCQYGEGSQAHSLASVAMLCSGTPGLGFSGAWEYHWLVMAKPPFGGMVGSIPPAPTLCTRSSSLTLRAPSHHPTPP